YLTHGHQSRNCETIIGIGSGIYNDNYILHFFGINKVDKDIVILISKMTVHSNWYAFYDSLDLNTAFILKTIFSINVCANIRQENYYQRKTFFLTIFGSFQKKRKQIFDYSLLTLKKRNIYFSQNYHYNLSKMKENLVTNFSNYLNNKKKSYL
ncbi:hypothetical protein RFI_31053, partial [Reticulomyxa filosa]